LLRYKDTTDPEPQIWPEISVLVAARNEEKNIANCLNSLLAQDYPKEKLNIIVGNDQSTDETRAIVNKYLNNNPNITLVDIVDDAGGLKAKARVMAQLDPHAKGEFYLVTDADVRVKPQWAKALVLHMLSGTGVASGTTMVVGQNAWGKMQSLDWVYFMGLLNIISYSGVPATAVGNNMIIRQDAYWQTGGYAAIKFSITEDYRLYNEVCKLGWKWNNIMSTDVLAYSAPTAGFLPLLHQRKRWLSGGKDLPWYWWVFFVIFGLYYFIIPILFWLNPAVAAGIFVVKILLQSFQMKRIYKLLGEVSPNLISFVFYEFYLFLVTISTAIFFFMPFKTNWKGRKY
jgi:cellulose synthase/poly-beta-1,6-N-acetylglucosamine synthase-like glycosyltransferase